MQHWFVVHRDNPQARLLRQAANIIKNGGIVVYPTDSGYAIGCGLGQKDAVMRIRKIRQMEQRQCMSLICKDLANLGEYATVSTPVYRMLKAFTPGAYTFILKASPELPKMMYHPKRKTLGLRIPKHSVAENLLEILEGPLMSTTLRLPGVDYSLSEPQAIVDLLGKQVDLIIDVGHCDIEPTSVIDLTENFPKIIRVGKGDVTPFQSF